MPVIRLKYDKLRADKKNNCNDCGKDKYHTGLCCHLLPDEKAHLRAYRHDHWNWLCELCYEKWFPEEHYDAEEVW